MLREKERERERAGNQPVWNTHMAREHLRYLTSISSFSPPEPQGIKFCCPADLSVSAGTHTYLEENKMQGCIKSKAKQLGRVTMGQQSVRASLCAESNTARGGAGEVLSPAGTELWPAWEAKIQKPRG